MIQIPNSCNYIAAFLTFACNFKCSYCINKHGVFKKCKPMSADEWVGVLNRLPATDELPITLQGGEPTLHPEFYDIVSQVNKPMDLLTNLSFDVDTFMRHVSPLTFKREAPYPAIRVSFHPEYHNVNDVVKKVRKLLTHGYQVGLYLVDHPSNSEVKEVLKFACEVFDIDFRVKEFLGMWKGKMYGTFKYDGAVNGDRLRECMCKTSELLIAPDGGIHRCHSDLYELSNSVGNIVDVRKEIKFEYLPCDKFGACNPCDVKVTTNRFQQYGHTSVDVTV